ncbi:MAG: carboxypeptidase regulatory-like domain-containing protein [Desulfurococcaceae archaeon]
MGKSVSILFLLFLIISIVIVPTESINAREKIHPSLDEKLRSMGRDDVVEVFIKLKSLPESVRFRVKGDYGNAVLALKTWASYTQTALVKEILDAGGVVINRFWIDNLILVRIPKSGIYKVVNHPLVEKVFDNFEVRVLDVISKKRALSTESWGIFKIRAPEVWNAGYTGEGVRIAVLDTGVDISHPALAGKMLTLDPSSPYYPGGWIEFDNYGNPVLSTPWDTDGHGTHCSGTALGGDTRDILIGVAPGAKLMHALILPYGSGTFAQVVAGMEWAVEPYYIDPDTYERVYTNLPPHVVSMSFGAYGYHDILLEPIKNMLLANIIPVAAIGNGGPGTSGSPGNIWGSFGIGATDTNDNVPYWSSGETVYWPSPPSDWPFFDTYPSSYIKPDFSAPGVDIVSAVPGGDYEAWSGTSMATPHVAGLVALILQAAGWLNHDVLPETVYTIINVTSIDLGSQGQDTRYGWGRVDAYEAVKLAEEYAKKTGVEGYVYDSISGSAIPWATVTVVEINKTVSVNEEGYFKIPLDPGTYTLLITAWGYYSKNITVKVVLHNGTIAGQVLDYFRGQPIPGASVYISVYIHEIDYTIITDENGFFNVSVTPGRYTLTASAPNYQSQTITVNVDEDEVVYVVFTLYPYAYSYIKGYVFDASNGSPIADASIRACSLECYETYSDQNGYYELNVLAGVYIVSAGAPGYAESIYTDVYVPPATEVWLNFSLSPIPKSIVVLGNTHYATRPHIAEVLSQLGLPIVEYRNFNTLLNDWLNGNINPAVIVIDHWYENPYSYPSWSDLQLFLQLALDNAVSLVFLGTSFSGYTGIHVLYLYERNLEEMGIPAPDGGLGYYRSPIYIRVEMLDPNHPVFDGVVPDDTNWFYLGNVDMSDYVDYLIVWFEDDSDFGFQELAHVVDDIFGIEGVGVGVWISPSGKPWFYLSSWGESVWMQYLEPGWDGVYSDNTMIVLLNSVKIAYYGGLRKHNISSLSRDVEQQNYTYVEIYLVRLPHGFVTGKVVGSDGAILAGAKIIVLNTPVVVVTDSEGRFTTWLPTGTYQALITYPGYYDELVEFEINEGVTTDLGTITLIRKKRVAVYYDNNGELTNFIENLGFLSRRYTDLVQLTNDVATGFYDLVIYAGTYGTPFPDSYTFYEFLNTVENLKLPVIWLDNRGFYGYGIKVLSEYTGDPSGYGYSFGTPMYVRIDMEHPLTRGYGVGDIVLITTAPLSDFSWFYGFSGETVATQYAGFVEWGGSIGWKISDAGAKWVLMSGFAPTPWTPISYWTRDAYMLFYNAILWSTTQSLNVTIREPYLHVGDQLVIEISGAPQYATLQIFLDGEFLDRISADANGRATYVTVVPLIPGGRHVVDVATPDLSHWGYAIFYVLPKIEVYPSRITVPGVVGVNITGLQPGELFLLYLNENIITIQVSDENGAYNGLIIIPSIPQGNYSLRVLDVYFTEITSTTIEAVNIVEETITQLVEAVDEINNTLTMVKYWLNNNISLFTSIIDLIRGNITTLSDRLNRLNATLIATIETFEGRYALLNTSIGLIMVRINELNTTLNNVRSDLSNLTNKVYELAREVDDLSNRTKNVDRNASTALGLSGTGIGLAIVALIAGVVLGFRKQ